MTYDEALEILKTGEDFPLDEKDKAVISQLMKDGYAYTSSYNGNLSMVVVPTLKASLLLESWK